MYAVIFSAGLPPPPNKINNVNVTKDKSGTKKADNVRKI